MRRPTAGPARCCVGGEAGMAKHAPLTYYHVQMSFFSTSAFFAFPAAGLFSCSRLCGTQSHVPMGRQSEHVGPSRPLQTRVHVKRMFDGSCDIWDLECHQCRQALLTWWWKSFSPTPTCQTCDHFEYTKIHLHDLGRILWSLLTHITTRWLGLFTCDPHLYENNINN